MADGLTHAEAGKRLFLSGNTIKAHTQSARDKLGAKNTTHAVVLAMNRGDI